MRVENLGTIAGIQGAVLRLSDSYDLIIDSRSSAKYTSDHIPGAVNFALFTNEQAAALEESDDPNDEETVQWARANVALQIDEVMTRVHAGSEVLVYGERSAFTSLWAEALSDRGVSCTALQGGYRRYRMAVEDAVQVLAGGFQYNLIVGPISSGKRRVLNELRAIGEQVLDVASMTSCCPSSACAPSLELLESELVHAMAKFSTSRPVWLESDCCDTGLVLMSRLKRKLQIFILSAPMEERISAWLKHETMTEQKAMALIKEAACGPCRLPAETMVHWVDLVVDEQWRDLLREVLSQHFDVSHRQCMALLTERVARDVVRINLPRIDEASCASVAKAMMSMSDMDTLQAA